MKNKILEIEWCHLDQDGQTCDRCAATGAAARQARDDLAAELSSLGWTVRLKETLLAAREIGRSNSIFINGLPLEELLPQVSVSKNCCDSCGDLLGASTQCRTIQQQGRIYEAVPAGMMREAAHNYIRHFNQGE
ncbi:MAG: DUF2703 domain-containing protein [Desulfosudaceae bacterium]